MERLRIVDVKLLRLAADPGHDHREPEPDEESDRQERGKSKRPQNRHDQTRRRRIHRGRIFRVEWPAALRTTMKPIARLEMSQVVFARKAPHGFIVRLHSDVAIACAARRPAKWHAASLGGGARSAVALSG